MKSLYPICMFLLCSTLAYGQQQPMVGLRVVTPQEQQQQPDPTGQRLQYLRKTANALEQTGHREQAAAARRQAEFEQQALLRRLDALQAEAQQIRQVIGAGIPVLVQLQIFEVSLTKLRSLGIDCSKFPGDPTALPNPNQPQGNVPTISGMTNSAETEQFFETLRKDNLLRIIAEPKMMTLSGQKAVMRAGPMLSVPKKQPDGSIGIEQQHGLVAEVTPEVLGDKVRLAFHSRMAKADYGHTVQVGKETIPGIQVKQCATTAEFVNGQTLVLRGPTETREESENVGLPYLSEIPYVGVPFRRVKIELNETAMFILVRPEIISSAAPNEVPIAGLRENMGSPRMVPSANGSGNYAPATAQRPGEIHVRR